MRKDFKIGGAARQFKQVLERLGGDEKAKPHSTAEGRKAAAKRRVLRGIFKPQTSPLMPFKPIVPRALKDKLKKIKG